MRPANDILNPGKDAISSIWASSIIFVDPNLRNNCFRLSTPIPGIESNYDVVDDLERLFL